MLFTRLAKLPRLARSIIGGLADKSAKVVVNSTKQSGWKTRLGDIERVTWYKDRIVVHGALFEGTLWVAFDGMPTQNVLAPSFAATITRPDPRATLSVTFQSDACSEILRIASPTAAIESWARLRAMPSAIARIAWQTPAIFQYIRTGDPTIGNVVRGRLGLVANEIGPLLPDPLFASNSFPEPTARPAIILPIYNAYDDVIRILSRFPTSPGIDHHLILVNDGSDDSRIADLLAEFAANHSDTTTLISSPRNNGFVAATNLGFDVARKLTTGHLILLNSDTLPPDNWVRRILAPIYRNPKVASVTPMSNSAEVLTVPGFPARDMPDLARVLAVDQFAQTLCSQTATADIPTGIGFCMAMNRAFLDRIGGFDSAFGRGYGEEVDWCQKARRLGGRNVAIAYLFVAHRGGASFGQVEKTKRINAASALISKRHPRYDQDVQNWVNSDPLATCRLALATAGLGGAANATITVYLAHNLGGGAEIAIQQEVKEALSNGAPGAIILRVGGPMLWRIEVITPNCRQIAEAENADQLLALLKPLAQRKIVYSCGAGGSDPAAVPKLLHRLTEGEAPYEMRLHDFFCVSPSWNLLDSAGEYHGPPSPKSHDPAHSVLSDPPVTLADWHGLWEPLIAKAREITAYSKSSAEILSAVYPKSDDSIAVRPHRLSHVPGALAPGGQSIGVLGGINHEKGGTVLMGLTRKLSRRLVVLGEMDSQFSLAFPHLVHGRYERDQINVLARRYSIGVWLIPSVCPETFSFATHEALATTLPVLSFDLGAQAEAVRKASNGIVLECAPSDITEILKEIDAVFDAQKLTKLRSAS